MPQQYLSDIRQQMGWGAGDIRSPEERSKDQRNTQSGNPMGYYDYSYDQSMGQQNPGMGRYRPPMMDANGGWQDQGGYAYNLPTNAGPFQGAFGSGYGPPLPMGGVGMPGFMPHAGGSYYTQNQPPLPQMGPIGGAKPQGPTTMAPPMIDQGPQYGGTPPGKLPQIGDPGKLPPQQQAVAEIMQRMRGSRTPMGRMPMQGGMGRPALPVMQRGPAGGDGDMMSQDRYNRWRFL